MSFGRLTRSIRGLFKQNGRDVSASASKNDLPKPESLPFLEKKVLLNINSSVKCVPDAIFMFHTLNDEEAGGDANNNLEHVNFVYCNIMRVRGRQDPETGDWGRKRTKEFVQLKEIVSLLESTNDEIYDCYRKGERILRNHLREAGNDDKYRAWGVAKWCLHLIEQIYAVMAPLIIESRKLQKSVRKSKVYKELAIPVPWPIASNTSIRTPANAQISSPRSSSPFIDLVKGKDLHECCESYLRQIEDDVQTLHRALTEIGDVEEQNPNNYDAYSWNEDETICNRSSAHDTVNLKIRKLINWKTHRDKVLFLDQEAEKEKMEHAKLEEKYHKLFDAARKKFEGDEKKLHEELDLLTKEESWQQFLITNKFCVSRINYDRQIEYSRRMMTDSVDKLRAWGEGNKERDRKQKEQLECRKAWLEAKLHWEKLMPMELFAEVRREILTEIGDGDETLSLKPLEVGFGIKALGFVPNDMPSMNELLQGNSKVPRDQPIRSSLRVLINNGHQSSNDTEFEGSDEGSTLTS